MLVMSQDESINRRTHCNQNPQLSYFVRAMTGASDAPAESFQKVGASNAPAESFQKFGASKTPPESLRSYPVLFSHPTKAPRCASLLARLFPKWALSFSGHHDEIRTPSPLHRPSPGGCSRGPSKAGLVGRYPNPETPFAIRFYLT